MSIVRVHCHSLNCPTDEELEDKKPLIVSGLKIVLHDQPLKVSNNTQPISILYCNTTLKFIGIL